MLFAKCRLQMGLPTLKMVVWWAWSVSPMMFFKILNSTDESVILERHLFHVSSTDDRAHNLLSCEWKLLWSSPAVLRSFSSYAALQWLGRDCLRCLKFCIASHSHWCHSLCGDVCTQWVRVMCDIQVWKRSWQSYYFTLVYMQKVCLVTHYCVFVVEMKSKK